MPSLPPLSEQVRTILNDDPRSFYRIAKEAGIHTSSVTRFASGSAPSSKVLDRIASVLKLTVKKE